MESDPPDIDGSDADGSDVDDSDEGFDGPATGHVYVLAEHPPPGGYRHPQGVSEAVKARREMADMLTDDLADPPYRVEGIGHDWVHAALDVPLTYPPMGQAYQEAYAVADAARKSAGEIRIAAGFDGKGLLIRVHGPQWSMVTVGLGWDVEVFVCADEIPVPLRVELDDRESRNRTAALILTLMLQVQRVEFGRTYGHPPPGQP